MPVLPRPHYRPPFPFTNGHFQTVYPTLFRRISTSTPKHERIETEDGDFLDIDWYFSRSRRSSRVAIISHGLEGHSRKNYPLGMADCLSRHEWDVVCLNFRGCSGEPNRLPRLYHSGVTDDLHTVLLHCLAAGHYRDAALIGFSMGGNQTLKYLGETPALVPPEVKAAVVLSVPCMLADSVEVMNAWQNTIYMHYFLRGLTQKVRDKARKFPGLINLTGIDKITTFTPFDDRYTAPLHGFKDAADYYRRCSSRQFLQSIQVPCLMIQALDDPFLSSSCYPIEEAEDSPYLCLEIPEFGGHVGFWGGVKDRHYWSERRAIEFLNELAI